MAQRWVRWLAPSLVFLFTLAAFLPALHNQFVNWDDDKNFSDNPSYRGLGWSHLRWMWTTSHMGHYIPLTWMTLGMDYLLWGMNPFGYHLSSLLLHAANAVVFYFVVVRLLTLALPSPAERGHALAASAAFAALVFAAHPLRVESVAWVTERRDVLSGLFFLLTILAYLRSCERQELSRWWYGLSVALFSCALLSKSMAVSLPVVLLILDVYPLQRLAGPLGWWTEAARRVYVEKIPFVLLAAAASVIAFKALLPLHNMADLPQLTVPGRLAVSAYGLSFYLWKMVLPLNLSPLNVLPRTVNPEATPFILSYGLVLAITTIALALRRRVPGLPAAWLTYVVILMPVLGIFQNGPQIAADRYTYLASLGWAILAGAGLGSCWRTLTRPQRGTPTWLPLAGVAISVVVALGVLTWNQVRVWHDSERLWTHSIATDPDSPVAQNNLGYALADQGKLGEAIEHYRQALRLQPDFAPAHTNWGRALDRQGKLGEAIAHFQRALSINPDLAEVHTNWGVALSRQGKLGEAIAHFQRALSINPDLAEAHTNLGAALIEDKPAEAIAHFEHALRIKPDLAEAHNNWGEALTLQGKLAEAIEHLEQAVRINPDFAEVHDSWGKALAKQGKLAEAIDHYRQALRIKPDLADAHTNWGVALVQQGKPGEAIEHFRQALRIKPDQAEAHANWALALTQQGKLAEAAEHSRQAQRLKGVNVE